MTSRKRVLLPARWLSWLALLSAGIATGWLGARRTEAASVTDRAGGYETAQVERRAIGATVLASGVVRPKVGAQVAVGSRASGVLRRLHVTVGDRVTAGQLLAELDRTEFETQVDRAQALRASAASERAWADEELGRVQAMADRGAAAAVELSAATRALDVARAREREAAAGLAAAEVQLGYTSIRAPIGGVVASVSTQEGETVAASFSAPTFVTIVDLARLEVWAYVDEADIGRIEVGQHARFTVDTWPDEAFEGRVTAVRPGAEIRDNVVNYVTLVEIEERPGFVLRPEMTATVQISLAGRDDALAVPNGALRRDAAGSYVLVASADGFERRTVEVGLRGSDFSEILAGIPAGARVLLGPAAACAAAAPAEADE